MSGIDDYRDVSDAVLVRERGLFVAEGRLVVRRVIEDGRYAVHSLLLNDAARRELNDVLQRLPPDTPIYTRPTDDFRTVTGFNFHRGCLALVHRRCPSSIESIAGGQPPLVLLEDVANADNVGGVFRNAAAFGAGGIVLSARCCDPFYRKAIRTSMGTVLHLPFAVVDDWEDALARVRSNGFVVAALTPREPAETIDAFARRARRLKVALLIGTEGAGLSAAAEAAADARVRIPIADGVDSLNVSVAAGIALFALKN